MLGTAKAKKETKSIKKGDEVTVLRFNVKGFVEVRNVKGTQSKIRFEEWKLNFEYLGITTMALAPPINQFGYPCEFKPPAFMQPFKFYTKYGEALKQVDPKVKLNHRMQLIRTITDGNILNKVSVELQRARALEMVTKKVKNLESWTSRKYPNCKAEI